MTKRGDRPIGARRSLPAPSGTFLIAGDIHGHWGVLAEHVDAARRRHGLLHGIFCVGDVQPFRSEDEVGGMHCPAKYRTIGDFPKVVSGDIKLGAPVWFIGGNHEPWPALDAQGPGEWIPGVTFLGRSGSTDALSLRVAFLSGIHSDRVSQLWPRDRQSVKDRCYWVNAEVETTAREGGSRPVDLLITHDWPTGVSNEARELGWGSEELEVLAHELRPTLYCAGHMHRRRSAQVGLARFEALSHILGGPDGSLVAEWQDGDLTIHEPLDVAVRDRRYSTLIGR